MREYQQCTRCVMDTLIDPEITFNHEGHCQYCEAAISRSGSVYFPNEVGHQKLNEMLREIKEYGKNKKYDCIMGLSGGLDSSYLAYLGYQWGLRVLLIHIDDGFDTEISQKNLAKLVKATGYDYEVIKPDAEQYNALTAAYMRAGLPNLAVPQDSVLFAYIYDRMIKYNIRYFLSGGNFASESIMEGRINYTAGDSVNIRAINAAFGTKPINKLKFLDYRKIYLNLKLLKHKYVYPLNYVDYKRERAFAELAQFCDFQYYGSKHLENAFTAFLQIVWYPKKFDLDKRKGHLSSLIVAGDITREQAIEELAHPVCSEEQLNTYISLVKEKLGISDDEYERIMAAPTRMHTDFKTEKDTLFYKIRHMKK